MKTLALIVATASSLAFVAPLAAQDSMRGSPDAQPGMQSPSATKSQTKSTKTSGSKQSGQRTTTGSSRGGSHKGSGGAAKQPAGAGPGDEER